MCDILRGGVGGTGCTGNLWNNDKSPSIKESVYIYLEWKQVGRLLTSFSPHRGHILPYRSWYTSRPPLLV